MLREDADNRASILWWMTVLSSSPTMSIPNSWRRVERCAKKEKKYERIRVLTTMSLALETLWTKALAVDEGSIETLDIFDEDLHIESANGPTAHIRNLVLTLLFSSHTSACCLLKTLESKWPLFSAGTVLALVCRPIFSLRLPVMLGLRMSLRRAGRCRGRGMRGTWCW